MKKPKKKIENNIITQFQIGEAIFFKGKNLKPQKILKEVLSDKLVEKYLKGYVQARAISKIPSYIE